MCMQYPLLPLEGGQKPWSQTCTVVTFVSCLTSVVLCQGPLLIEPSL